MPLEHHTIPTKAQRQGTIHLRVRVRIKIRIRIRVTDRVIVMVIVTVGVRVRVNRRKRTGNAPFTCTRNVRFEAEQCVCASVARAKRAGGCVPSVHSARCGRVHG
jgi:hypothetical protein